VGLFQFEQLAEEAIVLGIRNFWAILDVVQIVVASDFIPEGNQTGKDVGVGHRIGW
jgi:hypothetical protein